MSTDEIIEKLGDEFYEVKRLLGGTYRFVAYNQKQQRAFGLTMREALQNLLDKHYGYPTVD